MGPETTSLSSLVWQEEIFASDEPLSEQDQDFLGFLTRFLDQPIRETVELPSFSLNPQGGAWFDQVKGRWVVDPKTKPRRDSVSNLVPTPSPSSSAGPPSPRSRSKHPSCLVSPNDTPSSSSNVPIPQKIRHSRSNSIIGTEIVLQSRPVDDDVADMSDDEEGPPVVPKDSSSHTCSTPSGSIHTSDSSHDQVLWEEDLDDDEWNMYESKLAFKPQIAKEYPPSLAGPLLSRSNSQTHLSSDPIYGDPSFDTLEFNVKDLSVSFKKMEQESNNKDWRPLFVHPEILDVMGNQVSKEWLDNMSKQAIDIVRNEHRRLLNRYEIPHRISLSSTKPPT